MFELINYSSIRMDPVLLIVIGVWLITLTYFVVSVFISLKKLSKDTGSGNILKLLTSVLNKAEKNDLELGEIKSQISALANHGLMSVQKVGLTRFNPFQELGGEHSFSLALLNGKNTGVIITGLHARDKTRIYLKSVVNGKGDIKLSDEELATLNLAIRGNK